MSPAQDSACSRLHWKQIAATVSHHLWCRQLQKRKMENKENDHNLKERAHVRRRGKNSGAFVFALLFCSTFAAMAKVENQKQSIFFRTSQGRVTLPVCQNVVRRWCIDEA